MDLIVNSSETLDDVTKLRQRFGQTKLSTLLRHHHRNPQLPRFAAKIRGPQAHQLPPQINAKPKIRETSQIQIHRRPSHKKFEHSSD